MINDAFTKKSQHELLLLIAKGNEEAFSIIFHQYQPKIFTVALRYLHTEPLAEEAVQDVFIRLWTYRDRLQAVVNFEAFLFILARNVIFNQMKQYARTFAKQQEMPAMIEGAEKSADTRLLDEQNHELLRKALVKLPAQQRKIFELAREENLSHKEIGQILDISPLTVKKHMAQAIKSLKMQLQDHIKLLIFLSF